MKINVEAIKNWYSFKSLKELVIDIFKFPFKCYLKRWPWYVVLYAFLHSAWNRFWVTVISLMVVPFCHDDKHFTKIVNRVSDYFCLPPIDWDKIIKKYEPELWEYLEMESKYGG